MGMQNRGPCVRCGAIRSYLDHRGRCGPASLAACRATRRAALWLLGGLSAFVGALGLGVGLTGLSRPLAGLLGLVTAVLTGALLARFRNEWTSAPPERAEAEDQTEIRERPGRSRERV